MSKEDFLVVYVIISNPFMLAKPPPATKEKRKSKKVEMGGLFDFVVSFQDWIVLHQQKRVRSSLLMIVQCVYLCWPCCRCWRSWPCS
jgi:hypothetical protein